MGGILGIFRLDGAPLSPNELLWLSQSLLSWPPGAVEVCRAGPLGLASLKTEPVALSSTESQLPLSVSPGRLILVSHSRLDNRTALGCQLDLPVSEPANILDGRLMLAAYQRWGDACPDHLLGDWALAVYDSQEMELFLARDHFGNTGLFYYLDQKFFAFSSSLRGLLTLPGVPRRADEMALARRLANWRGGDGTQTAYTGIRCLPPAHWLKINQEGLRVQQYWYLEKTPPLRLPSDDQYVEAFTELFQEAVRCRLDRQGEVGILLSSGLDSGSIAALAAPLLAHSGSRLQAFSSVPILPASQLPAGFQHGDERSRILSLCGHVGGIDPHLLDCSEVSPIQGIRQQLSLTAEHQHAAPNAFWVLSLLQAAQRSGIHSLLTGQSGNLTISWDGAGYYCWLARQGEWQALFQNLHRLVNRQHISWGRAVAGRLIKPAVLPAWEKLVHTLSLGKPPWAGFSAINPAFAARLQLAQKIAAEMPAFPCQPQEARLAAFAPGRSRIGAIWQSLGSSYQIEVRDPTADKRLLEFCFALPDDQFTADGLDRRLVRRAMVSRLPQEVLYAQRRGRQAVDIIFRLRKSKEEVDAALDEVENSSLAHAYLDIPLMRQVWSIAQENLSLHLTDQCGAILLKGLSVGLFLAQCEYPPACN